VQKVDRWVVAVDGVVVEPNYNIVARTYTRVHSGVANTMATLSQRSWDPFRRRMAHTYNRVQTVATRTLSGFNRPSRDANIDRSPTSLYQRIATGFRKALLKLCNRVGPPPGANRFAPTYIKRVREGINKAVRRKRKRKFNALGKVVGFSTQKIPEPLENVS
jgi:hypothetical protein